MSVKNSLSGASALSSKIRLSYLMIMKMTKGIVDIKSLFIVVAFDISAKKSQTSRSAGGDSKKVKRLQLIQAALPNMVTYEFRSSLLYLERLSLALSDRVLNSPLLLPAARNSEVDITVKRNQTERCALITNAPAYTLITKPEAMIRMSIIGIFFSPKL